MTPLLVIIASVILTCVIGYAGNWLQNNALIGIAGTALMGAVVGMPIAAAALQASRPAGTEMDCVALAFAAGTVNMFVMVAAMRQGQLYRDALRDMYAARLAA